MVGEGSGRVWCVSRCVEGEYVGGGWGREWKSVVCVSRCVEGEYVGGGGGREWKSVVCV